MSGSEIAIIAFLAMLVLIFLRLPIAAAMALTGFVGNWIMLGRPAAILSQLKNLTYDMFTGYSLTVIPLFLLMGQFATKSGMSRDLYVAAADWVGHFRGGLAISTVGACAGFGAVCGSSLATVSTMSQVALPEMRRYGYSESLATGVLAAGGTLGILIPPSIILIIYAILTEQNIVKMFAAAMVPGILAAVGYIIVVILYVRVYPSATVAVTRKPYRTKWRSLARAWPVMAIFVTVIGGIYVGLFTPTEGAAVGMLAAGAYGVFTGGLDRKAFLDSVLEVGKMSAMIFFILLGAQIFNTFLGFTRAPHALAEWVSGSGFTPYTVLAVILVCYLVFGCIMDSLSMILLTIPIFFPIIEGLDFGLSPEDTAIWFGILALVVVEIGLISPPVGMNLFVINSIAKDVPIQNTYRGVAPFVVSDLVRVFLLIAVPPITLTLVHWARV